MGNRNLVFVAAVTGLACVVGCDSPPEESSERAGTHRLSLSTAPLGSPLPGIDPTEFASARTAFATVEGQADGLGPIFNERSCGGCHSLGTVGGAGQQVERRFGRFINNVFDPFDGSVGSINVGGSLLQLFTVGNFNNPNLPASSQGSCQAGNPTLCCIPQEFTPSQATVFAGRLTTPLFGLGLVDAMPDAFFDALAASEPASVRGIPRRVPILLPDVQDPSQSVGMLRVARFGWKAAVPTLQQFAADAYLNEMGITTQSCFQGTSINTFAHENLPDNRTSVAPVGCDDLAPLQPADAVAATGMPVNTDDAVGACDDGLTAVQGDIADFFAFMTFLAPPGADAADRNDSSSIAKGSPLFNQMGCANCHTRTAFVTPPNPPTGVPGNFEFHPYSDFLTHDMGTLGDRIGVDPGETVAQTRRMRTAPLWGIAVRNKLLHDGRTTSVDAAIRAHDGQGAAAKNAYVALSSTDKHAVVQFVRSIGYDTP